MKNLFNIFVWNHLKWKVINKSYILIDFRIKIPEFQI